MYRILFVCHGNICRSTCAQMVFSDLVAKEALSNDFFIPIKMFGFLSKLTTFVT